MGVGGHNGVMSFEALSMQEVEPLNEGRLVVALSGWMDGGDVSIGTVEHLVEQLDAERIGEIDPDPFFILNFPGSMEISSIFRPYGNIEEGIVESFEMPSNVIYVARESNLALFLGREPNMHWRGYVGCLFEAARRLGVTSIYFVGSVGGLVTHTREPRIGCAVSRAELKERLEPYAVKFTSYEGPVSVVTYLLTEATGRGMDMITLVAEIPAYVQGRNPKSIEAVTRMVCGLLGLPVELESMRGESDEWEKKVTEAVSEQEELAEHVRKLEAAYDDEVFDTQMGDLKDWLEKRGVRLD